MAREEALATLTKVMREEGASMEISVAQIFTIHTYEPKTFGLDVPEPVVREAYIMRPDLSPIIGWETGRPSVPFFMELNLEAVRGSSLPRVVLYQLDLGDPMNPHGLLIAYAEAVPTPRVLPVCSDFDTFTVGSKGMRYALTHHHRTSHCNARLFSNTPLCALFAAAAGMRYDAMPVEQQQIIQWELDQTEHIVKEAPAES